MFDNMKIQKSHALLIIVGMQILSIVLLANSSSGAPITLQKEIRHRIEALVSLQDPGGIGSEKELAQGRFLVASRKLKDPNFHKTVILLLRFSQDGASGLVINRPLKVKLSTLLPDFKDSEHRDKALYLGGPVEPNKMLLLVKSASPPPHSLPVFKDVYISSSREELQRLIKSTNKNDKFKIFAGYAGWAPRQLEAEHDRGDWHVFKADTETVFDKKFSEIWQELIQRFRTNWVRLKPKDGSKVQK